MKRILLIAILGSIVLSINAAANTTVTWWQFWTDPAVKPTIEAIVADFEEANPDIDVKLTDLTWANGHEKIVIAFSSGTGPDVVELGSDWIAQFAEAGHLADIGDAVSDDSAQYQGWGMATYKDKIYGRPWILGTRVIFVNQDLVERAGFDRDFVPVSWPTLREAAYKIDSLGEDIYGWGSNTAEKHRLYKKYMPFFWSAGGRIFTDDKEYCIISSFPAVEALNFYKELHDSAGYVATQRGIEDAFLDGKVGIIMSGDWLLKRIKLENRDINISLTSVPGPDFPAKSFLGGEFLAINARSENKEAAQKLIDFVTSPENQIRFCKANYSANPSSLEAQKDPFFADNEYFQAFIRQIRSAVHPPVDPDWVLMEDIIEEAIEDALFGDGLPAEALLEAQHKISDLKSE